MVYNGNVSGETGSFTNNVTNTYKNDATYGESGLVEWDMHNDHYEKLFWHLYDNIFKQDTCSSAMHVDFDSNSEGLDKFGLYRKAIFGY